MARSHGSPEVRIGLIDGPVAIQHKDLAGARIRQVSPTKNISCVDPGSVACTHATFIAGILSARRGSLSPAICPGCPLLVRPIFEEKSFAQHRIPAASPRILAAAMTECIDEGARIINLSLSVARSSAKDEQILEHALEHALKHGVIVVAAAGNQGSIGSPALASNPWLLPVVACDPTGRPMWQSNLGRSISIRGLRAPGKDVVSLTPDSEPRMLEGTSVAVPFVTGAIALLWSQFPKLSAAQIRLAVTQPYGTSATSIVPRLLHAENAYQYLLQTSGRRAA